MTDVNEPPAISGDAQVSYAENGTGPVHTYTAADPESDALTWTLGGDDAGDFNISSDGALTFQSVPDFENPADEGGDNVYNVTVAGLRREGRGRRHRQLRGRHQLRDHSA